MPTKLSFTKMQGAGNDYIYFNCLDKPLEDPSKIAKVLSDRHFGVGGDGIILILPSEQDDFRMRMYNPDGSEAEMCGNAVRCVAKYLYEKKLTQKKVIDLQTENGTKRLEMTIEDEVVSSVRANMGEPILDASKIPVDLEGEQIVGVPFEVEGFSSKMTCVSMGNPHAIFFVDEITDDHIFKLGPIIENHNLFPNRTNVEFIKVLSPTELEMRVWERGTGETFACGTGAAAVCVASVLNELSERKVTIHLRGGDLELEWGEDNCLYKTGTAEFVFEGVAVID